MHARTDNHVPQKWKVKQSENKFFLVGPQMGAEGGPNCLYITQSILFYM